MIRRCASLSPLLSTSRHLRGAVSTRMRTRLTYPQVLLKHAELHNKRLLYRFTSINSEGQMPNLICYQILMSRTNFYHLENACNQEANKHLHFCILPPMPIQALTCLVETQLTILFTANSLQKHGTIAS